MAQFLKIWAPHKLFCLETFSVNILHFCISQQMPSFAAFSLQCDPSGRFLKVLVTNFIIKVAQVFCDFLGFLQTAKL